MTDIKVGDTVEVSFKAEVVKVPTRDYRNITVKYGNTTLSVPPGLYTVIEEPLKVGDIVTPENVHLLPETTFILADSSGSPWNVKPPRQSFKECGPFKLIYIHNG